MAHLVRLRQATVEAAKSLSLKELDELVKKLPDHEVDRIDRRVGLILAARAKLPGTSHLKTEDRNTLRALADGAELIAIPSEHRADEIAAELHTDMPWMGPAMPLQKATVQWRPDEGISLSALAEQVDQYQEHLAAQADLHMFPAGPALVQAPTMGQGLAAVVDAMAADEFRDLTEMALNLQMSSFGPSARLAYATRQGVLRLHYETLGPEAERPVFERRLKFDETLLRRLAEVIRPH